MGVKGTSGEIMADATTSFTILLAIFFPSVTGLFSILFVITTNNQVLSAHI